MSTDAVGKELKLAYENLTRCQTRCSELINENRSLSARVKSLEAFILNMANGFKANAAEEQA